MRAGSAGGREPRRYIQGLERVSKGTQASLRRSVIITLVASPMERPYLLSVINSRKQRTSRAAGRRCAAGRSARRRRRSWCPRCLRVSRRRRARACRTTTVSAAFARLRGTYRGDRFAEKRKAWVYEVPLPVVYHLRESVNAALPEQPIPLPLEVVDMYDAPVLASTVKLWMLELDPPLAL